MGNAQVRDFLADRREIVIDDSRPDDPLRIVYRPGKVNAEYQRMIAKLGKEDDSGHKVGVYAICTLVTEWTVRGLKVDMPKRDDAGNEIVDDYGLPETEQQVMVPDDQVVPLTSKYVRYLATPLLLYILRAINEDMSPDPKSGTPS